MNYDPKTQKLTLSGGQRLDRHVVEAVLEDVLEGRAVVLRPVDGNGKYPYLARTATDVDGRSIVAERRVPAERLVRRIDRYFRSWGQRQAPAQRQEDCTYPSCSCRPLEAGGPARCHPPVLELPELQLVPADDIAPPCGACGKSIRVPAKPEPQSGSDVYRAVCSDPECGWRALVVVTTQVLPPARAQGEQ